MKEKYYYLKRSDSNGLHRCGVVYLIAEDETTLCARGVALCNDSDRFIKSGDPIKDKKIGGIEIARGRALRALNNIKSNGKIKRIEAKWKVYGLGIKYKSEFNPVLNSFEQKILMNQKEYEYDDCFTMNNNKENKYEK